VFYVNTDTPGCKPDFAIGLWLMACLAVVGYFTQGINSSMNKLTAILQIILIEMILLSAACIPLEVRLKRNRD
jgi:hypothetical protein